MSVNENAAVVGGKYLMYKNRPLVREGDTICYGDMTEKYILILDIMNYTEESGVKVPKDILVQIVESDDPSKCVFQQPKVGLYDALGYGTLWLEQELAKV